MKTGKITLILTLLGILILIFLAQNAPIKKGIISKIKRSQSKTTIQLKNHTTELIIFKNLNINLKTGDKIKFQGTEDNYKGKKQIIIEDIHKIQKTT